MIDITLRHTFDGAGTSTARNVAGPSLLVQTTAGLTATVEGSNMPEVESSWQTLGTATGLAGAAIDCPFAFVRVQASAAGTVSISAPEGGGAGSSSGGSGGSTADREVVVTTYVVKTAFSGASVNDTVTCTQVLDVSSGVTTVSTVWRNQTTAADLPSAPSAANLTLVGAGGATDATLAAGLGAPADAAAGSDTTSTGLIGLMKRLLGKLPSSLGAKSASVSLSVTPATDALFVAITKALRAGGQFNRPADTTAYAVGDLIANSTTAGSVTPISIAVSRAASTPATIIRATLFKSGTSLTNASFRAHFFQSAPTHTNGDNGALACNGSAYLGRIDFTMDQAFSDRAFGFSTLLDPMVVTPTATEIFCVIEARAAYTPVSGEIFGINLEVLQD